MCISTLFYIYFVYTKIVDIGQILLYIYSEQNVYDAISLPKSDYENYVI